MRVWICAGILAAVASTSPVLAQQAGDLKDRPAKMLTGPSVDVIRAGIGTVGLDGECVVEFTVGLDGKPKDMKPTCTPEAYAPVALEAMAAVEYQTEIFAGEYFETEGVKQAFKFTAGQTVAAVDPRGEKAPVLVKDFVPADIRRAIDRVKKSGSCDLKYTIGANGQPKNIQPNCTPSDFNSHIEDAVEKLRYEPGQKGGKAVDWPNFTQPLNLTNQD